MPSFHKIKNSFARLPSIWLFLTLFLWIEIVYISMLPNQLTWANYGGDGGDFLSAILTNGIPHPTGYPTYTLLGKLFQFIPISTPYFRGALLSAFAAGFSIAFILKLSSDLLKESSQNIRALALTIISLSISMSPLFWSQAIIVEVHALQSLFFCAALWWVYQLFQYQPSIQSKYQILLLSAIFGLGLGNHITLVFLIPLILIAEYAAFRRGLGLQWIGLQIIAVFAGLCTYLYIPLAAIQHPPINWGNPQNLQGFLWLVTGRPYQPLIFQVSLPDIITHLTSWVKFFFEQIGVLGVFISIVGILEKNSLSTHFKFSSIYIVVVYSLFWLIYNATDSLGYLIPVLIIVLLWTGNGICFIWNWRWKKFPSGKILVLLFLIYLVGRIPLTYTQINPQTDQRAAQFAETYLKIAPENAILLTTEDADTFPLWYYHFGLRWRTDVKIIVASLAQFSWYRETLPFTYPDLAFPPQSDNDAVAWINQLIAANPRRIVCRSHADPKTKLGVIYECPLPYSQ